MWLKLDGHGILSQLAFFSQFHNLTYKTADIQIQCLLITQ